MTLPSKRQKKTRPRKSEIFKLFNRGDTLIIIDFDSKQDNKLCPLVRNKFQKIIEDKTDKILYRKVPKFRMSRRERVISHRIANKLSQFIHEKSMCDACVIAGGKKYPVIKILLASRCKWFERKFSECQDQKYPTIEAPMNPDDNFGLFLEMMVTGKGDITLEKLPSLIKMATFYESEMYITMFRYFLGQQCFTDQATLLSVIENLVSLDLERDAIFLAPKLSNNFIALLNGSTSCPFTWVDVLKKTSPMVFVRLMTDALEVKELEEMEKVKLIEEFASYHTIMKTEEKEALASLINWDGVMDYRYLNTYDCDWVPDQIARKILSNIITMRRRVIASAGKDIKNIKKDKVSRWFTFTWCQAIRDCQITRGRPKNRILDFISTLGGNAMRFDPIAYGMLSGTGNSFCLDGYGLSNLFKTNRYYMAIPANDRASVTIDLRDATVQVQSIEIDTSVPSVLHGRQYIPHSPVPSPSSVELILDNHNVGVVPHDSGDNEISDFTDVDVSKISIVFGKVNSKGGSVARLSWFDVTGQFNP